MPTITAKDGTRIYYKDWGSSQPIVFSHGWPLSADAFEDQMFFLASRGYRCIAHDRRGHGRSDQPWQGNDMDTYADDLATLADQLDLHDAIHVGHSTGGGEVARYIGPTWVQERRYGGADRRRPAVDVKDREQSRWFADGRV
jgi:non-heme chloroperoxidase